MALIEIRNLSKIYDLGEVKVKRAGSTCRWTYKKASLSR